jgi:uncharacterized membrane protein
LERIVKKGVDNMAKEAKSNKNVDEGKLCAFLSYLLIGIIWYFADDIIKKNGFVKFHVKQGIIFLIAGLIFGALGGIFVSVPAAGSLINNLLGLCILVLLIFGIINVLNGKEAPLPIIGGFAKKLTF